MSRNPYNTNKTAKTQISVCAFIDILGFSAKMEESYKNSTDSLLLQLFRKSLSKAMKHLKDKDSKRNGYKKDDWTIKAFTDNIILGIPIKNYPDPIDGDGEFELSIALNCLALFQLELVLSGFFIRGCVSIGQLYVDKDIVFGEALLESYNGEAQTARDPRIIFTDSAIQYIMKHFSYYGNDESAPQNSDLLIDGDGQMFLNYLDWSGAIKQNKFIYATNKHRDIIVKMLDEFKSSPNIWNKYIWCANYHNFICDTYEVLSDKNKVSLKSFTTKPYKLSEIIRE